MCGAHFSLQTPAEHNLKDELYDCVAYSHNNHKLNDFPPLHETLSNVLSLCFFIHVSSDTFAVQIEETKLNIGAVGWGGGFSYRFLVATLNM